MMSLLPLALVAMMNVPMADDAAPPRREPAPTPAPALHAAGSSQSQAVQAALLREGSHLLHAHGEVRKDESRQEWRFHIEPRDSAAPDYRLSISPNTYLGEILQVLEASQGQVITFELTGQVYVFRGRNYLLVTHPPRVVGQRSAQDGRGAQDDDVSDEQPEPEAAEHRDGGGDGAPRSAPTAADLMRDLQRDAGPIHRSVAAPPEPMRPQRGGREQLLAEGTLLVQRRGRVSRDAGGAWLFILESDVDGLGDPPMVLLPCLLLQRIEEHVQRSGAPAPVLLSGRVTLFEGRNHLLPTLFLVPRERTPLTP